MTPNEMTEYEERLKKAAAVFGWVRISMVIEDENGRDCDTEYGWSGADGAFLIADDDISEGLALELIRLAGSLETNG